MKCEYCRNYNETTDQCRNCQFEYDETYNPYKSDDWDILNLNTDEWEHHQIRYRLHFKGIDCLHTDIWGNNNIAYIIGTNTNQTEIAKALNLHTESVYSDYEHGLTILNLYQEKQIRKQEQ